MDMHLFYSATTDTQQDIWNHQIRIFSPEMDDWILASAKLDSGTNPNWIHPKIVKKGCFEQSVNDRPVEYRGITGQGFIADRKVSVEWQPTLTHKSKRSDFLVASYSVKFDVLLGKDFIVKEDFIEEIKRPHVFSKRAGQNKTTVYDA